MITAIQSVSATSASQADIPAQAETPATVEELRVCSDCADIKPLTDFRRRFRGREDRMYQCRQCHASAEFQRRKHHRAIKTGRQMRSLATAMKCKGRSAARLETLLRLSIVSSGGFEAMLRNWHGALAQCIATGKPTPRHFAFYE